MRDMTDDGMTFPILRIMPSPVLPSNPIHCFGVFLLFSIRFFLHSESRIPHTRRNRQYMRNNSVTYTHDALNFNHFVRHKIGLDLNFSVATKQNAPFHFIYLFSMSTLTTTQSPMPSNVFAWNGLVAHTKYTLRIVPQGLKLSHTQHTKKCRKETNNKKCCSICQRANVFVFKIQWSATFRYTSSSFSFNFFNQFSAFYFCTFDAKPFDIIQFHT